MNAVPAARPGRGTAGRFGAFALVGGAGFVVDTGIVLALVHLAGWHPIAARCVSFPVALALTWQLNRRWTWSERRLSSNGRAMALYVTGQGVASALNMTTFAAAVMVSAAVERAPLIGLVLAAGVGLLANYIWSSTVVFRAGPEPRISGGSDGDRD